MILYSLDESLYMEQDLFILSEILLVDIWAPLKAQQYLEMHFGILLLVVRDTIISYKCPIYSNRKLWNIHSDLLYVVRLLSFCFH